MGILDAILMFSKGRESTLLPRVPLQRAYSEEKGCLKPSVGETQRHILCKEIRKAGICFRGGGGCVLCSRLSPLLNYTLPERKVDYQEKKQWLKYQSWHVFF